MGSGNRKRKQNRSNGKNRKIIGRSRLASISEEESIKSDASSLSNGGVARNSLNDINGNDHPVGVSFLTPSKLHPSRSKQRIIIWLAMAIGIVTTILLESRFTLTSFCDWDESTRKYLIVHEDAKACHRDLLKSKMPSNLESPSSSESSSLLSTRSTPSFKTIIHTIIDTIGRSNSDHAQVDDMFCRGSYEIISILSQTIPAIIPIQRVIPSISVITECQADASNDDNKKDGSNKQKGHLFRRIDLFLGAGRRYSDLFHPTKKEENGNIESHVQQDEPSKRDGEEGESFDWTVDVSSPLAKPLTESQQEIVKAVSERFQDRLISANTVTNDLEKDWFHTLTSKVSFGGRDDLLSSPWWDKGEMVHGKDSGGNRLLSTFLKIMQWPKDLVTTFPSNLCSDGCSADFALSHTLEYREKYRPWLLTPSAQHENRKGWIYVRGYSPTHYHEDASRAGHSIIWFRPGLQKLENEEAYTRTIVHTIDKCIADVHSRTVSLVGKCNIVLDAEGFGLSMIPNIKAVKKTLKMLQDHFPDSMGVLVLINMGRASQMFMSIVNPFLPDVVRRKIHVVPNDVETRRDMLSQLIDHKFIPTWLGGTDDYRFDVKQYYEQGTYETDFCTEEEGIEYIETMPYHA